MELVGERFGHIHVTEVVGQGAVGDVYGAYDEKLERKVAVKVLSADQRLDSDARERLLREARALSRLDHPNICRIHDYIESDKADLLVLEFIDGRTLTDVTEELSRREKLRIASAVANVLVVAHREGIVHRDLKPDNVMLTRAGEVKVLDFGLARWLHRAAVIRQSDRFRKVVPLLHVAESGDTLPFPAGRSPGRPLATAIGVAIGTPVYMSPEQARGEELTPASDMFSFGLLMQFLFTGREPHPQSLSAREVIRRVSAGETDPARGVPLDIATLINRLKQLAPADRPTAVETLERLERLASRPQRVARNGAVAAAMAVLAFGGWRYTVDLDRARAKAVAAQEEAERRRAQLETTVDFMIGDLRTKLEPVGRLDILDDVGNRALDYFESLDPKVMSPASLARNAKALNQLADVRVEQGKPLEALVLARHSLTLTDEALRREPRNGEVLLVHGASHFWIGNALRLQGKHGEAFRHMRAYMADGDALASLDPKNQQYQLERAYGHSAVALVLEAEKNLEEALKHYRVSLGVKEELARRAPDDANAQAELARALNKVGAVLYRLGDIGQARTYAEREVAIYRKLVAREPDQTQWRQRLATSMGYLGRCLQVTDRGDAAFALWQEELSIERELAARDPQNVRWQRNVASTLHRLALELEDRGDLRGAVTYATEARTRIAAVASASPETASYAIERASIDVTWALVRAAAGDTTHVRETLRNSLAAVQPLYAKEKSARYAGAYAAFTMGEVARDRTEAEEAWRLAEETLAPVIPTTTELSDLDLWFRILARRNRNTEAQNVLARMRATGYSTKELEPFLRESSRQSSSAVSRQ